MTRQRVVTTFLAAVVVALACPSGVGGLAGARAAGLADSPWPMFQHDPQHTGRSPYVGPAYPALQWRLQLEGLPGSPAIGADGTIYLPTGNEDDARGFLYAINPDGGVRWRYEFPTHAGETPPCATVPTITTPAIADDGTIYVHTHDAASTEFSCTAAGSDLYAINSDGSLKWVYEINAGFAVFTNSHISSPAIADDGTIYLTSRDTGVYAINPNGTEKWVASPEATSISSSPAIAPDGTVYVNIFNLHAFDPSGAEKWNADIGSACCIDASPSVGPDGTIYACGSLPDACNAVGPDGGIRWSFPLQAHLTTPAISGQGTIYLVDRDTGLYAVSPDGTQLWHTLVEDEVFSQIDHSPLVGADGRVYARQDLGGVDFAGGVLRVLDPDGSERSMTELPGLAGVGGELSAAIGSDGTLYVPQPADGVEGDYNPNDQYLAAYVAGPPTGDCEKAKKKLKKAKKKVRRAKKAVKRADDPGEVSKAKQRLKKAKKKKRKAKKEVQKACGT